MMGMGQQMPMRRPPMGPSPMTAGRPNPMAGFQGGTGGSYGQFGRAGPTPNWTYQPPNPNLQASMGQVRGGMMPDPYEQNTPGAMWGGQFVPAGQQPPGGAGAYDRDGNPLGGGGMSDAQMHPFAPRNQGGMMPMNQLMQGVSGMQGAMQQRRFPGALQRGIMQGMAPPPQPAAPMPNYGQNFASAWGG